MRAGLSRVAPAIVLWLAAAGAAAAEGPELPGTAGQIKTLGTEHGLLGTLLAIALTVIGVLFTLLMRAGKDKDAATAKLTVEHNAAIKEKDEEIARERAEWHSQISILQEARLSLLREVMTVTGAATSQLAAIQTIIAERNTTAADQNAKMYDLINIVSSLRSRIEEEATGNRSRHGEMLEMVSRLPRGGRQS